MDLAAISVNHALSCKKGSFLVERHEGVREPQLIPLDNEHVDLRSTNMNSRTERRQLVRINGCDSGTHIISHGVPQWSVLAPSLFSLFTNDLPKSLRSAETYLYADDTTICCIAETMELLTNTPNNVLAKLQECMVRQKFDGTTPRKM